MRSGISTCYINNEDVRKTLAQGATLHRTRVWDLPCQERAVEASSNTDARMGRATKDSDFVEKLVRQLLHSLLAATRRCILDTIRAGETSAGGG
jgi:hypothetical protein